jgi:predicted O-methyltransferase YrrM
VSPRLPEPLRRHAVLLRLGPRVAPFYFRARRVAAERGDTWSETSATHPKPLAELLRLARGRTRVVEIGTGTAWTTVALALANPERTVLSYDPIVRPERDWYLEIGGASARSRIELIEGPGEAGPPTPDAAPYDFVFIDGSHERERTIATFNAWMDHVTPGGVIAFHDWENPNYPGVTEAIKELGIAGDVRGEVFIWTKD